MWMLEIGIFGGPVSKSGSLASRVPGRGGKISLTTFRRRLIVVDRSNLVCCTKRAGRDAGGTGESTYAYACVISTIDCFLPR
jgi:hypothetical protein